jgi:hypothetical protein
LIPHIIEGGVVILQYADDTILLMQDDMEQIIHLELILYMFEAISGLEILKSEVMMVIPNDEKKIMMLTFLGVRLEIGQLNIWE